MRNIKQFFLMIKYELIRVSRNKVVFSMLLFFCSILLLILSYVQINTKSFPIAIYNDGINIDNVNVMEIIENNVETNRITYVDSKDEGIKLIKKNKVSFFICLDSGETKDEITAIFYYDQTNTVARSMASKLNDAKNEYAYETLSEFLLQYGIKLNETYFELIRFESTSEKSVSIRQMPFALEIACCVSLVLMLGLAYSIARDNETQISKNIAYLPVGINRYLLSKIVPYFLLGIFQIVIMSVLGGIFFEIEYETNVFVMILLSSFFVLSTVTLSTLFATLKSQIATIFLDMMFVLLPIFVSTVVYVQACPVYLQIILNCFPITPFINFFNGMIFNGVILWRYIIIFGVQIIVYYFFTLLIMKKRIKE